MILIYKPSQGPDGHGSGGGGVGRQTVAGTLRSPGEVVNGLYQVVSLLTVAPESRARFPKEALPICMTSQGAWMVIGWPS